MCYPTVVARIPSGPKPAKQKHLLTCLFPRGSQDAEQEGSPMASSLYSCVPTQRAGKRPEVSHLKVMSGLQAALGHGTVYLLEERERERACCGLGAECYCCVITSV